MQTIDNAAALAAGPIFVPIALDEENMAVYAEIGAALGCSAGECAEGFMHATVNARSVAVATWVSAVALRPRVDAGDALAGLAYRNHLSAMRLLLGLDADFVPHARLAAAGLRIAA